MILHTNLPTSSILPREKKKKMMTTKIGTLLSIYVGRGGVDDRGDVSTASTIYSYTTPNEVVVPPSPPFLWIGQFKIIYMDGS